MKKWYYHKDFPTGEIFEEGDQPKDCVEHPDDVTKKPKPKKTFMHGVKDDKDESD